MLLETVEVSQSTLISDYLRLSGTVIFDSGERRTIWFDIPSDTVSIGQNRGDAWAILLLPAAIERGESLNLGMPVDPVLHANLLTLQRIWHHWYPELHPVAIVAPLALAPPAGKASGLFFSGGVDSIYSLLHNIGRAREPDSLVMVWGFDLPIGRPEEFAVAHKTNAHTASQFGKTLMTIATNLKEELPGYGRWWGRMSHGAGLAGIGQLLAGRFDQVFIGSTHDYTTLSPWGSHPLTDPLYGSSTFTVVHDGAEATRVEKTALIAGHADAARGLRVCWEADAGSNCSGCSKCLRTMVTLDLIGQRAASTSFDWSKYTLAQVTRMFLKNRNDLDFSLEILVAARALGREDIVQAVNASIRRSWGLRKINLMLSKIGHTPYIWRLEAPLRKTIFETVPKQAN
jgi:hypothetical protein